MPASVLENSSSNGRTWHGNLGGNAVSPHVTFVETKTTLPYVDAGEEVRMEGVYTSESKMTSKGVCV